VKITWPLGNCKPRLAALSLTALAGKLAQATGGSDPVVSEISVTTYSPINALPP